VNRLTAVSLFSGCGGGDLGAARAGADTVFAIDNNKDAVASYLKYKHWLATPDAVIKHGSVASIDALPECDLLLGCYPCQSFTMGGPRLPGEDPRTTLFVHFRRSLKLTNAKYFVTENVAGLAWLRQGKFLRAQLNAFRTAGAKYNVSVELIDAKEYGVPQDRKRVFIVGVRKDLALHYCFPSSTNGPSGKGLPLWASHGDAIAHLPIEAIGEYYDREDVPFSWWYMSRNRKRHWEDPSFTIQANWRHVPLHPASPTMVMVSSNLSDGFKQDWTFTGTYDHLDGHPERTKLEQPRRLSWRECAAIQTFPINYEPVGPVVSKYRQIGNATPPLLMEIIVSGLCNGTALSDEPYVPRSRSIAHLLAV